MKVNDNTYFQRLLISEKEVVKLNRFLSKKSVRGRKLDNFSCLNFLIPSKEEVKRDSASAAIALPTCCAAAPERRGSAVLIMYRYNSFYPLTKRLEKRKQVNFK